MRFRIYRYSPEKDQKPFMQDYELNNIVPGMMLLDALLLLKEQDPTLAFRRSCREGVCGSDGMNINGTNGLACITPLSELKEPVEVRPMPRLPVIRDLIVDMDSFYKQYRDVKPYLIVKDPLPEVELQQTPEQRDKLDGLYECILCGCCSTACPSFWWNPDKFLGPAALLQAARFIEDSRDQATEERLDALDDPFKLFRCHTIMNCIQVCPKDLNPTKAIGNIKKIMVKKSL
ncbi:MAG: succinate dehydrogenase iron-sulfur subunit [Gammaproteobacteria bacterium]|nr:succinate dehydrogenase iron-sulfur subunit [Gammaproteobacteria bacterium]MDH5734948.1 succinate dehydrogenase iron-sulfur subunit [Gammaproteobacteria bacterium]